MKKVLFMLLILALIIPATAVSAQGGGDKCTTIQSGELYASTGEVLTTGYDVWGYNYNSHMFNGMYCDYRRGLPVPGCPSDNDSHLSMKWNDAWLANEDCDGDGLLDRHYGFPSYIGSGAWLTNHEYGTYTLADGTVCDWDYFTKIVAAPADASLIGGVWYAADGVEIGPVIWGQFATIQEVENDPCFGLDGLQYASPDNSGVGGW